MTELNKRVIDGVAPITLAECVMMGDGTTDTLLDRFAAIGNNTNYNGKKVLWLGDSISVSGSPTYPKYVCDALGMTLTNKASSGGDAVRMRNILQGLNGYSAIDMTQFDYMFMMIGHNCDGVNGVTASSASINNIPLDGTSYTEFPNGFYTDVASCVEYVWNHNPDCKMYFITPTQSPNARYAPTTVAAQKALKEIGNLYSIPVIDVFGECGISRKNIDRFSSDKIHPNSLGVKTIGDYIINYLYNVGSDGNYNVGSDGNYNDTLIKNQISALNNKVNKLDDILKKYITKEDMTQNDILNNVLTLTKDKYQECEMLDGTEIVLPTLDTYEEIHLFFSTTDAVTIIMPDGLKYQQIPSINANKTYEFIFTYTNTSKGWVFGYIEYEG